MGLWQRFKLIFASKANKALDRAEDPRETLDYSYEKQLELLQKVRRGVADVATSRKRLELQITSLEKDADKVYAFFNNCHRGQAAHNAELFRRILGQIR